VQLLFSRLRVRTPPAAACIVLLRSPSAGKRARQKAAHARTGQRARAGQNASGGEWEDAHTGAPSTESAADCGTPIPPPAGVMARRLLPNSILAVDRTNFDE